MTKRWIEFARFVRRTTHRPARLAMTISAAALLAAAPTPAEVLPEARPMLDRLEKAVDSLRDIEARFAQVRHLSLTDEEIDAGGRLRFLAPDSFRLDYKTPDADVLTMHGDSLQVYFSSLGQAQRYRIGEEDETRNMFLIFSSRPGYLEQKYDISLSPDTPEGRALRFQPLDDDPDYAVVEIWVHLNRRTGLPERIFFREEGGDTVLFRLSNVKTNRKLAAADFVFVPPPGTEIIAR